MGDKNGSAYEPYIFAALNSARVMVVLGTNAGNATKDKVFVPSSLQVKEYFADYSDRICIATDFAIAKVSREHGYVVNWWLRTPGENQQTAVGVAFSGSIYEYGYDINSNETGVRPAVWVDLN